MEDQFKVKVNEELEYQLNLEDLSSLDALATSPTSYHVLVDSKPFTAQILQSDFHKKSYEIKINSNTYSITIEDKLDLLIDQMGFALSSARNISSIEAPMPGLILEISVEVGQEVQEDDPLLILEAMKMENVITSPRAGIIKSIQVSQGDAVDKDNLLIEFE
ncbi:acetyl-CoA carboxylase biotin carboxyl carrier protein subunit [Lentiprolixibacter aurantiacus]|uniref:Acetyl-CoA carboxylase biotin carboxyl carrier protein subunit n=1 Tax=Lentiprolixibacter aurantiacus TaxID=2993939 RepID=A0AAE3MM62_9FLAO|nr:acetyl-CoA carboxylase biotin carboxyl carrier protein subunit [Lentiprolixibacter aurantiacus]MCX2720400.1 acetyl-CoA carboxylase biotin carboxyl carrier protein subunit [Lentiprolixibacter aurantiacus]